MEQPYITLFELVKQLGLPTKEVRQRFANRQLKINNVLCTALDHKIKIKLEYTEAEKDEDKKLISYREFGEFLTLNNFDSPLAKVLDIKDFFGEEPTNIKQFEFVTGYTLISISKKEHFVFMNL